MKLDDINARWASTYSLEELPVAIVDHENDLREARKAVREVQCRLDALLRRQRELSKDSP